MVSDITKKTTTRLRETLFNFLKRNLFFLNLNERFFFSSLFFFHVWKIKQKMNKNKNSKKNKSTMKIPKFLFVFWKEKFLIFAVSTSKLLLR